MAYLSMSDGARIFYLDEGEGRSIVMVHGWKASCSVYEKPCQLLTDEFRCIRYDQCGHVRSTAPKKEMKIRDLGVHLREITAALCTEKPVLVGWSMGAATVMEYIRQFGCRDVAGVVFVDYPPKIRSSETWKFGRNVPDKELNELLRLADTDFRQFLYAYYMRTNADYPDLDEAARQKMIDERMQGHDPALLASLWKDINETDYLNILPEISVPAAVFYADRKPVCCQGAAEYYAQHIPGGAKLVKFEGASHALISEQPERFAKELRDFVRGI